MTPEERSWLAECAEAARVVRGAAVSPAPPGWDLKVRFAALEAKVDSIADALAAGGGSAEAAAVIARIDALQEQMRQAAQAAAVSYDSNPGNDLPV